MQLGECVTQPLLPLIGTELSRKIVNAASCRQEEVVTLIDQLLLMGCMPKKTAST